MQKHEMAQWPNNGGRPCPTSNRTYSKIGKLVAKPKVTDFGAAIETVRFQFAFLYKYNCIDMLLATGYVTRPYERVTM